MYHRWIIDPARLDPAASPFAAPLALIDLAVAKPDVEIALPACPVVGLGDPSHPLAARLDAIVESPVSVDRIVSEVVAQPLAASTAVSLLRGLPGLPDDVALAFESLAYGLLQGSDAHRAWLAETATARPATAVEGRVMLDREDAEVTIILDNVERGNAIDRSMRDALREAFALATVDPQIERVRLLAKGKAFSLGAELGEFGTTSDPAAAHAIRMRTLPAPLIARCANLLEVHVQGACVGAGLEMAAWAKRITATPNAWFQLPELAMGLIPGAGGCVSVSRRIGRSRAALLILSGRRLSARAALAWGLIDAIVDKPA